MALAKSWKYFTALGLVLAPLTAAFVSADEKPAGEAQVQMRRLVVRAQGDDRELPAPVAPRSQAARTQSLEEEVAELRARIDRLTAPTPAATSDATVMETAIAAPLQPVACSATSTVPGTVFDGTEASAKYGNDGLTFISKDGNFKTHLGGLVQLDGVGFPYVDQGIFTIPGGAGTQDAVTFRRLRLRAEGTMYENIDWVSEVDLALALQNFDQREAAQAVTGLRSFPPATGIQGGNTINVIQPTTVFMTLKEIPFFGNIRIGNQQDWLGFEHIESARFLDFMERAPIMDAFLGASNNGYTPGISAFNNTEDKRVGIQYGVYKNNVYDSGYTYSIGDAWTYNARAIWTPYYDEESKGRYMVHTGIGAEYRSMNTTVSALNGFDNVRVRSRGDLRNASSTLDPNYADTGNFYANSQTLIDPELAVVWGPWLFQAEYTASWFGGAKPAKHIPDQLGGVFFDGGYVETLVFLTGENRTYNQQTGTFGRVVPNNNWDPKKGCWGAWQLGLRYDWLDLNSGTQVNGGNARDLTFGVNWFLNPNARLQLNYVVAWIDNDIPRTYPGTLGSLNGSRFVGQGDIQSIGGRLDFNW